MLNHIDLMGRLTADPELKRTTTGVEVCSATVAVERDIKDKGGKRPTDFIGVTAWRGAASFLSNYFRKGDMVALSGRLQSRKWTDKNGNNRVEWEVQAENIYFCGKRGDTSNTYDEREITEPVIEEAEDDGTLPF